MQLATPRKIRKSKNNITESLAPPEQTFELGEKVFTVKKLNHQGTVAGYIESAEFLDIVDPLVDALVKLTLNKFKDLELNKDEANSDKQPDGIGAMEQYIDFMNDLYTLPVTTGIEGHLPKLVSVVCHGTDPTVTEEQIMIWAKTPKNPLLMEAVIAQINVEELVQARLGMTALLGKGVSAPTLTPESATLQ
jgi:hypothetical protein